MAPVSNGGDAPMVCCVATANTNADTKPSQPIRHCGRSLRNGRCINLGGLHQRSV